MSEQKEKYQQQILFEEIKTEEDKSDLPYPSQQVILESDEIEIIEPNEELADQVIEKSKPRWLWRIAFFIFMVLVTLEAVEFFMLGFSQEPFIASLYALLLTIISLIVGGTVIKEYRGLRQFKRREKLQKSVKESLFSDDHHKGQQLCQKISEDLPCDLLVQTGETNIDADLTDAEQLRLYSRQVLTSVDKKALDKTCKYSTESVVLVALSPIAIVDMMLMLWRNLKMIDEIAHLYGLKLSYWSRIKLLKQVFINMVYAGATELIADVGTDLIGADLLGKLSARLAQGLGAGMLTARLGLKTMHLCRPIPFEQDAPKLKDVRKQLIGQIKSLTNKDYD
ncbi:MULTISPECIES: TIGR01620 family protein [Thalassotalea]|uniref:TIGR01620 family protein n=1 Tax=Thalassotalea castellviae TaxID=3075612 RepID=A0ABU2ZYD7_9GAMM|nr:TIGR01620 family protein [Thalassotalea sp. W431]MDT0602643.1 TIGR01620 family protein [Thalassotalea sp. W431]